MVSTYLTVLNGKYVYNLVNLCFPMGTDQVLYVHTYILRKTRNGFPCILSYYGFHACYSTCGLGLGCFFRYSAHKLLAEQLIDRISTIVLSKDRVLYECLL